MYDADMKRRALPAMLLVLAAAVPAWAQQIPNAPEPKVSWLGVVIASVLTVCVILASIMSAMRGHRD